MTKVFYKICAFTHERAKISLLIAMALSVLVTFLLFWQDYRGFESVLVATAPLWCLALLRVVNLPLLQLKIHEFDKDDLIEKQREFGWSASEFEIGFLGDTAYWMIEHNFKEFLHYNDTGVLVAIISKGGLHTELQGVPSQLMQLNAELLATLPPLDVHPLTPEELDALRRDASQNVWAAAKAFSGNLKALAEWREMRAKSA